MAKVFKNLQEMLAYARHKDAPSKLKEVPTVKAEEKPAKEEPKEEPKKKATKSKKK